jgi:CheY-like chemotaxis protein/Tfp pilus assembly protein PilZ
MVEGVKILFADGNKVFLELCKTHLNRSGTNIITCQNGKDALDIIRKEKPHLAVIAAEIPILNGLDCCKTVKMDKFLRSIPVLLTLSSGKQEEIERCLQAGCDDILLKPINRHTLYSVIKKYIILNKRMAPRFRAFFPVYLRTEDGQRYSGRTFDVSTKGLFVEAEATFTVNSIISVAFTLPSSTFKINCRARVSWINKKGSFPKPAFPAGFGLEFVELSEEDCDYIREYIRKEYIEPLLRRIY